MAEPAAAPEPAAGSQEHGFWRFPVVPEQI
jgi:hypothetical protein